jgi:hypothetical protein
LAEDAGEGNEFVNAKMEMVIVNQRSVYILGYVDVLDGLICATKMTDTIYGGKIMLKNSFRIYYSAASGDDARTPADIYGN